MTKIEAAIKIAELVRLNLISPEEEEQYRRQNGLPLRPQDGFPVHLSDQRIGSADIPDIPSPPPVAALRDRWHDDEMLAPAHLMSKDLDYAIKLQAHRWRKAETYHSTYGGIPDDWYQGWRKAMDQCADELEGKSV